MTQPNDAPGPSDVVERLRGLTADEGESDPYIAEAAEDAIAKIERLEEENARLEFNRHTLADATLRSWEKSDDLELEVERLREGFNADGETAREVCCVDYKQRLQAENIRLREQISLAAEALVEKDTDEAYHRLYEAMDPNFERLADPFIATEALEKHDP